MAPLVRLSATIRPRLPVLVPARSGATVRDCSRAQIQSFKRLLDDPARKT